MLCVLTLQAGAPAARPVTMHEDCGAATATVASGADGDALASPGRAGELGRCGRPEAEPMALALGVALSILPANLPRAARAGRDGRVAEGARLESVYTGNRIVGSNPTPSVH